MDIVLRATIIFWSIYLLVRMLGKRELAQLTPFELIVLVATGDLVQQGVTHNDFSLTGAILAVAAFAFWASVLSWATYLSPRMESILDGDPTVVVRNGAFIPENMRAMRVTTGEVESEMRLAGIGSLAEVQWGTVEAKGRLSLIRSGGDEQRETADEDQVLA